MIQQGQVFKLKAKGVDGQPLWAYRYRLEGRTSTRAGQWRPLLSGRADPVVQFVDCAAHGGRSTGCTASCSVRGKKRGRVNPVEPSFELLVIPDLNGLGRMENQGSRCSHA
jgi:hypothetical protein